MDPEQLSQLEKMAGRDIRPLLQSRESTLPYLDSLEPKLRSVALTLLTLHWAPTGDLVDICARMGFKDPDQKVRGVALRFLGRCLQGKDDPFFGQFLAHIAKDPGEPFRVRRAAYEALFILRDVPVLQWPSPCQIQSPQEMDWAFVNSFLGSDSQCE